jgi:polyisoprenyl-phosphate glycosyltransferase
MKTITIILPCYNENATAIHFLESLELQLASLPFLFCVVVVDDCSSDNTLLLLQAFVFKSSNINLKVIRLRFNAGHQAAIYQGFLFASPLASDHFIVMDSDGEDPSAAIPALLANMDTDIVNVVRSRRTEPVFFRVCYAIYKMLFRFFTGRRMNFGNFCLISRPVMEHAVSSGFSHLAAFLSKQQYATKYIMAPKQERLGGTSKMGFGKLFVHAVKSFIEYKERLPVVFLRILVLLFTLLVCCLGYIAYEQVIRHAPVHVLIGAAIAGILNMAILIAGFFLGAMLLVYLYQRTRGVKIAIYEPCSIGDAKEIV